MTSTAGAEGGEPPVADLGGDAVAPGMNGAGVVDGDPSTAERSIRSRAVDGRRDGAVQGGALAKPARSTSRSSATKASSRPVSSRTTCRFEMAMPIPVSRAVRPLAGHLALDMARQDEPAQRRAEPADDPGRQGGDDRLSVRRDPALPAIADHPRHQQQILDDDVLISLEARPTGADAASTRSSPITRRSRLAPRRRCAWTCPKAAGSAPRSPPCPFRTASASAAAAGPSAGRSPP